MSEAGPSLKDKLIGLLRGPKSLYPPLEAKNGQASTLIADEQLRQHTSMMSGQPATTPPNTETFAKAQETVAAQPATPDQAPKQTLAQMAEQQAQGK